MLVLNMIDWYEGKEYRRMVTVKKSAQLMGRPKNIKF